MDQNILPGLYLVATPIGNMEDSSERMKRYLSDVDLIACEDTREMKKMLSILGIQRNPKDIVAIHEHNEMQMSEKIIEQIKQGSSVAYASDAGMPAISDPGQILVDRVLDEQLFVTSIPGATAVTTAFALSGFQGMGFSFKGFFPRSKKDQDLAIEELKYSVRPVIFYESPKRLISTLTVLEQNLDASRRAVVCRELTKKFEQISRGTFSELKDVFDGEIKGECVLVIESAQPNGQDGQDPRYEKLVSTLKVLKAAGVSSKDAVLALSFVSELPKNKLKELFLKTPTS